MLDEYEPGLRATWDDHGTYVSLIPDVLLLMWHGKIWKWKHKRRGNIVTVYGAHLKLECYRSDGGQPMVVSYRTFMICSYVMIQDSYLKRNSTKTMPQHVVSDHLSVVSAPIFVVRFMEEEDADIVCRSFKLYWCKGANILHVSWWMPLAGLCWLPPFFTCSLLIDVEELLSLPYLLPLWLSRYL